MLEPRKRKIRSVEDVKYIVFYEIDSKNMDKVIEKFKQLPVEREKAPEKFPKTILTAHNYAAETKGFGVYEADDPKQLHNFLV